MKFILILIITSLMLSCCAQDGNDNRTTAESEESSAVEASSEISEESIDESSEEASEVSSEEISEEPKLPEIITEFSVISSPYRYLGINAGNPWDLIIHDGFLYVGGGDYDKNTSPKKAYRFDLKNREWQECGEIPDEQIDRFILLDNELYIPGTDPTEDWSFGNFYKLENDEFVTYRTIPNGIHCFDLALHGGKIFAAVGIKDGGFPVMVSEDGGKSFEPVEWFAEEEEFELKDERVYQLFQQGEDLYALCSYHIFKYDGEKFVFEASWKNKITLGYDFYTRYPAEAEFNGKVFFTSGYLFYFEEAEDLKYILFEEALVSDLAVYDDWLYVLTSEADGEGGYITSLRKSIDGESFETVCRVKYDLPALSFALDGSTLYLGMGEISAESNPLKGTILKTEIEQ